MFSTAPASPDAPTPAVDATGATSPGASAGLEFGAEAILDYYRNTGLTCGAAEPSTDADGWIVRECSGIDANGRRVLIGLVTDAHGALGDGYASVTAKAGETVIGPEQALDHLSGFLGAMLGSDRASPLLPWLARSMGNAFEETKAAGVTIATYRRPADDLRTIWLEVAGPGYPVRPAP